MIRVEITETTWRTDGGVLCNDKPVDVEAEAPIVEVRRTLLVQEFSGLDIRPIVAYLNGLQTEPTCECGHPKHKGRCPVYVDGDRMGYSGRQCECKDYRTPEQARVHAAEKMAVHITEKNLDAMAESKASTTALLDELARVTRSRDRLRRTQNKRRKR